MKKRLIRRGKSFDVRYESILGESSADADVAKRSAARSVNCGVTAAYWLHGGRNAELEHGGRVRIVLG